MKKKSLRRLMVSGLLLTAFLAGCGSNNNDSKDSTDKSGTASSGDAGITKDDVTIKFSWWGADNRHEAMQKVVDLYEKANPNVTVEVEYGAWDGWQAKVLTQLSGKTEADVMQVNYNWLFSFGQGQNVFYDMNKVKDYIHLENWDEGYLEAMQVQGAQSAVPYGMTARVMLMNEALYKEKGLELPQTYDDLLAAGKVIAKDNTATGEANQYAMVNNGKVSKDLFIAQMLYDNTGKVMQTDGKVNYSVEDVEKVLEQFKALEDAGAMPTFAQDSAIETNANPQWVEGNAGGTYEWANSLAQWAESYKGGANPDDLTVGPYLQVDDSTKPSVYVKPNFGYAISQNSKNPEVAADFINFIMTDEEAVAAAADSLGISSNKVTYDLQVKNDIVSGVVAEGYDLLDGYEQTVMDPYFEDENVRGERYTAIEAFRSGTATAKEAAKQYVEKQQEALDQYYRD
ncbi:ABC transporter substrate-binding protein [Enterococcus nangangensis]|uniref:ABC transporter substrate-binding protein n=1 Tax=Enterococcus nangangensis TaxID=2559926 RepID=UPI0010FA0F63|nr:extracellular solute-binding protein [Enterococcus nangangensis]